MEMDDDDLDEVEPIDRWFPSAKPIIEERAAELEERLRPVLDDLGLKVRIWNEEERYAINFEQPRRPGLDFVDHSPIAILFGPRYFRQYPVSKWGGSAITEEKHSARSLGRTGFKHWRDWTREEGDEPVQTIVTMEDKQFLKWLRARIRSKGLVNLEKKKPGYIQNDYLVDAYFEAIDDGDVKGVSIVTFPGDEEQQEALSFRDCDRQRVHVVFDVSNAHVFIDGEPRGYFSADDASAAGLMLCKLQEGFDIRDRLSPSRRNVWNPYGTS